MFERESECRVDKSRGLRANEDLRVGVKGSTIRSEFERELVGKEPQANEDEEKSLDDDLQYDIDTSLDDIDGHTEVDGNISDLSYTSSDADTSNILHQ